MKYHPKQTVFMEQMDAVGAMHLLFDSLAGVSFFAKTKQFELIFANHSFLERIGMQQEMDIVGKTDFELFPKAMADNFRKDDTWGGGSRKTQAPNHRTFHPLGWSSRLVYDQ